MSEGLFLSLDSKVDQMKRDIFETQKGFQSLEKHVETLDDRVNKGASMSAAKANEGVARVELAIQELAHQFQLKEIDLKAQVKGLSDFQERVKHLFWAGVALTLVTLTVTLVYRYFEKRLDDSPQIKTASRTRNGP